MPHENTLTSVVDEEDLLPPHIVFRGRHVDLIEDEFSSVRSDRPAEKVRLPENDVESTIERIEDALDRLKQGQTDDFENRAAVRAEMVPDIANLIVKLSWLHKHDSGPIDPSDTYFMFGSLYELNAADPSVERAQSADTSLEHRGAQMAQLAEAIGFGTTEMHPDWEVAILRATLGYKGVPESLANTFIEKHLDELLNANDSTTSEVAGLWKLPEFLSAVGRRIEANYKKYDSIKDWPEGDARLLERSFSAYGFDKEQRADLESAWSASRTSERAQHEGIKGGVVRENFDVMSSLMAVSASFPRELHQTFGIRHFLRYDPHDLAQQMQAWDRGQTTAPGNRVVLAVSPISDHNRGFEKASLMFGDLHPVYAEAGSLTELARRVISTRRHLGRLNALILGGHGNKNSIELNDNARITTRDLKRPRSYGSRPTALEKIRDKDIFTPGAEIVLRSCSTGAKGGIAEHISRLSAIEAIAPKVDSGSYISWAEEPGSGIHNVVYTGSKSHIRTGLLRRKKLKVHEGSTHQVNFSD
jgi:hypothetical protein